MRIWHLVPGATDAHPARLTEQDCYRLLLAPADAAPVAAGTSGGEPVDAPELYLTDDHGAEQPPGRSPTLALEIPRRIAPIPPEHAARLLKRPLGAREGAGALLAQFLTGLVTRAQHLRPWVAARLESVIVDLFAATLVGHLDTGHATHPIAGSRDLTRRIRTHIQQHLGDPGLTPRSVAAHHHISVSYLHRLFQCEDLSVAARIRHERLEAARGDLVGSADRATPVHVIAERWGFAYHSSFVRAFQAAYGMSPRACRLDQGGTGGSGGTEPDR
ncbi:helix-turn-helix domain-containing protein [Streptomyces sp. B6B3]|uniref:helix-turn-helix domain-containing protein n=1 Tax=Streptomyces sp. B6B3 TaxID=3153570 RepID=UPI00325D0E06